MGYNSGFKGLNKSLSVSGPAKINLYCGGFILFCNVCVYVCVCMCVGFVMCVFVRVL